MQSARNDMGKVRDRLRLRINAAPKVVVRVHCRAVFRATPSLELTSQVARGNLPHTMCVEMP